MWPLTDIMSISGGTIVGFVMGLFGGGGSVLAVPMLVYVIGVSSPHVAVGTSAIAGAVMALANLVGHATNGNVKWPCATVFSLSGVAGAALGVNIAKSVDGHNLLSLFGVLMVVVGLLMLRNRRTKGNPTVRLGLDNWYPMLPALLTVGLGVGLLAGFFGIGGGFLIVPGLMWATGMPLNFAVGTSLLAVTAFGLTSATSYALSGLVDWRLSLLFVVGGLIGGRLGVYASRQMIGRLSVLATIFAVMVIFVGVYVIIRGFTW